MTTPKEAVANVRRMDREHRAAMDALQTGAASDYDRLKAAEATAWAAKQDAREALASIVIDIFGVHVFDLKRLTDR